jgi:hypothetical protein
MEGISKEMTRHEKILAAEDRVMAYWTGLMVGCFVWSNISTWSIIAYELIGLAIAVIIAKAVEVFWKETK